MSKTSMESVRYSIKIFTRNGLESVLSQSSLDNAMEICSAVENVLTLTYLHNKHFHTQVCRNILTQHGQHTIKDRNINIIRSWVGVYTVQCTGGAGRVFYQHFKPNGPYSRPLVCEQDSKGGMSNEFGEICREVRVTYRIEMYNCWKVSSDRLQLESCISWTPHLRFE